MTLYVHENNLEAFLDTNEIFERVSLDDLSIDAEYDAGKSFVQNLDDIWDETIFDVFQDCLNKEEEGAKYLNKLAQKYLATESPQEANAMDMTAAYLCGYTVHSLIEKAGRRRLETDSRALWEEAQTMTDDIELVYDGEEDEVTNENWREFEWKPNS